MRAAQAATAARKEVRVTADKGGGMNSSDAAAAADACTACPVEAPSRKRSWTMKMKCFGSFMMSEDGGVMMDAYMQPWRNVCVGSIHIYAAMITTVNEKIEYCC